MPWRDTSGLFPHVDTEQRAGGLSLSSAPSSLLGVDTPADVAPPASATPSKCAWLCGCPRDATDRLTGFCDYHSDFWADEVSGYTRDIGRGELP